MKARAVLLLLLPTSVAATDALVEPSEWLLAVLLCLVMLLASCCGLLYRRLRKLSPSPQTLATPALPRSLLYDDVSDLPNKWLAKHTFNQHTAANHHEIALLLIKIDRFSEVDQKLGHSHANLVLHQIAQRLRQFLQQQSGVIMVDGQPLAHLNGVDFLLLLDPHGRQHQAGFLAHQLEQQIAEPLLLHGCAVHYHIRCGIACYPAHGADFNEVLANAYLAQQQRPDNSPLYQQSLSSVNPDKLVMMAELQQAVVQGQLQLDVQPQVLLTDRQVVAAEVLLRWQHPQRGLLAPRQFIPLAEEMGLMYPLTCWVLQQAVTTLAQLQGRGIQIQLSVNLSSRDLLEMELVEQISGLLHQHQVAAKQLVLELKEDALMYAPAQVMPVLKRLAELGTPLVLDDFGSGYSSLGMLREMPISQVKIDAQFVQGLLRSDAQVAITGAMIDLAKNLQLMVVAEGVEDQATAERLVRMGCSRAQGFLFSQPFALAGLEPWLKQHSVRLS
jgi:diguanylate cyclase (GGDEF)-like protein